MQTNYKPASGSRSVWCATDRSRPDARRPAPSSWPHSVQGCTLELGTSAAFSTGHVCLQACVALAESWTDSGFRRFYLRQTVAGLCKIVVTAIRLSYGTGWTIEDGWFSRNDLSYTKTFTSGNTYKRVLLGTGTLTQSRPFLDTNFWRQNILRLESLYPSQVPIPLLHARWWKYCDFVVRNFEYLSGVHLTKSWPFFRRCTL